MVLDMPHMVEMDDIAYRTPEVGGKAIVSRIISNYEGVYMAAQDRPYLVADKATDVRWTQLNFVGIYLVLPVVIKLAVCRTVERQLWEVSFVYNRRTSTGNARKANGSGGGLFVTWLT